MSKVDKNSEKLVPTSYGRMSEKGKVFGKPLSEYVAFQKAFLGLIGIVGITRLGLGAATPPACGRRGDRSSAPPGVGGSGGIANHDPGHARGQQAVEPLGIGALL